MRVTEDALKENLKQNNLCNLYFFYGKEVFLVETYTKRVCEKIMPEPDDFNLVKFIGNPVFDALEEAIETLPVFAEKKLILLNDLDAEKTDSETLERIIALLSDIPDYCAVIISVTGFELSKNAKTKKLLACAEKHGIVCEFEPLSRPKAAELIIKKASRLGCNISRTDAELLYDVTLGSLTMIGAEVEKLCAYIGEGGTITRQTIELLVPRLTEAKVFALSKALTSRNAKAAFHIFDDLMAQNESFDGLLAYLSKVFIGNYHAKLGSNYKNPGEISYARNCIKLLYKANINLRTHDKRYVFEKTMTEILTL
jgi:DNA polymerase-3 subunit delta